MYQWNTSKFINNVKVAPSGRGRFRAGPKKRQAPSSQQSSTSVNEKDFEVEKIVDVKLIDDKLYYHFRWLGYADEESTWESIDTLINAVEKIRNFQRENSEKMVKVTSEPAIEGKRMSLVRGTTHVEKVLVICLKEEAID